MQEIWKDVKGYEGYYQISNKGRVRSLDRTIIFKNGGKHFFKGKIISQTVSKTGYWISTLSKNCYSRTTKVHILIAKAFIPNPLNKPQVNHKDLNKLNNKISNLEWVTAKENMQHAWRNGAIRSTIGTGKNILMLDKKTKKVLKDFNSITNVKKYLNIKECASIYKCIHRYDRKSAYGYDWRYKDETHSN